LSVTDIHAQPRKKTPVDRPLRKPYITCAQLKKNSETQPWEAWIQTRILLVMSGKHPTPHGI